MIMKKIQLNKILLKIIKFLIFLIINKLKIIKKHNSKIPNLNSLFEKKKKSKVQIMIKKSYYLSNK